MGQIAVSVGSGRKLAVGLFFLFSLPGEPAVWQKIHCDIKKKKNSKAKKPEMIQAIARSEQNKAIIVLICLYK